MQWTKLRSFSRPTTNRTARIIFLCVCASQPPLWLLYSHCWWEHFPLPPNRRGCKSRRVAGAGSVAGRMQFHAEHRHQPTGDVAGRDVGSGNDRPRIGLGTARLHQRAGVPARHRVAAGLEGFLKRIDQFLGIADRHYIGVTFVLFDGWDPFPKPGHQREPYPHRHNSGWVQSPGHGDPQRPRAPRRVEDVCAGGSSGATATKPREVWDVYNEPDNRNDPAMARLDLTNKKRHDADSIQMTFAWARSVIHPTLDRGRGWVAIGPIPRAFIHGCTAASSRNPTSFTFHNYCNLHDLKSAVNRCADQRPIVCTEYMARPAGSTFEGILPEVKERQHSRRLQLGLRRRQNPDDLSVGFMAEDLHRRAAGLVSRYFPLSMHPLRRERSGVH